MSHRRILNLAVIGLPPQEWSGRYAPALLRLEGRVRIAKVFDPLPIRAQTAAAELSTRPVSGIRSAFKGPLVGGTLLLSDGWQCAWMMRMAVAAGHPCFVGQQILRAMPSWFSLEQAHREVEAAAEMVPECLLRYQPSLLRLRELIATRLGPARQVRFCLQSARRQVDPDVQLREVLNWFTASFEVGTAGLLLEDLARSDSGLTAVLSAGARRGGRVELRVELPSPASRGDDRSLPPVPQPFCLVDCAAGRVALSGGRELTWETDAQTTNEKLAEDRSATAVALDLFARRAVGGLIPVPALADLTAAQRLADEIEATSGG